MTLFYPDLSNYQAGYMIPPGTPAVVAKATEGTYYTDSSFHDFQHQATMAGIPFSGYHFLKAESAPADQAQYYYNFAGKIPCMLDVETEGTSRPSVDQVVAFTQALKGLGGHVWGVYFPQWYWGEVGGNLGRLTAAGAVLISSDYTPYSDGGPGWNEYGNAVPTMWQYTNTPVDMNAFKGTPAQLAAIINGSSSGEDMNLTDTVTFSPNVVAQFPELAAEGFGGSTNVETLLTWTAARVAHLVNEVNQLKAGGASNAPTPQQNAAETLAELKARL
jgi:lysozyme